MADIRDLLLAAFRLEYREHADAIREALTRARAGETVNVREIFRRAHSLKGAARAVDLPEIEAAAHAMEDQFARALEGGGALDARQIEQASAQLDTVERQAAAFYGDGREAPEAGPQPAASSPDFMRVDSGQVQRLSVAMHELSANLDFLDAEANAMADLQARSEALSRQLEAGHRLEDGWARLLQEARTVSRGIATAARQQRDAVRVSLNAASRLREEIERVALAPASSVFGGLDVMLRDMAAEAGAQIEPKIAGLETQADRTLLQSLRDPVIHLLRNAVAHGLEPARERRAAGKAEVGEVGLVVRSRAGKLELTVFDDGRGPDLARIEAAAIARGLLPARMEGEAQPSADRLMALVFEPGFSTATAVDRMSGRGMGLSVVAEAARRAGGGAFMRRRRPVGAEVVISAPLSAARQPVLLAFEGEQLYGLPTRAIERVLQAQAGDLERLDGRSVLKLQHDGNNTVVPVVSLGAVLGIGKPAAAESDTVSIAILRQADQRLGVRVDAFEEVRTATVAALTHPDVDDLVQGAVQLERDQVAIVINPEALMRRYARNELNMPETPAAAKSAARRKRTILVVDDSVTTRTLEKSILETSGFAVVLAVDGVDALNRLHAMPAPVDLIVADIEMPSMDGFQLLAALKSDNLLARIPLIMMTSRAHPEDVRRGMELGASAYLVKQTFDQRDLLDAIGQLL